MHSAVFYLLDSTFAVSKICETSIFDIMERDAETVILIINYIIEKGNTAGNAPESRQNATGGVLNKGDYYDRNGVLHKRVTMKNAAGGWY